MKRILTILFTVLALSSFGQILQDPSTSPSTARTNDAISGAYTASGTDTYTISPVGSFSYTWLTGKAVSITFTNVNTGSSTLDFDGLGAKNIRKWSSGSLAAVAAGDLIGTVRLRYDGTQFVVEGGGGSSGGGGTWGSITGTLSNQTDLQTALDLKANKALTHNTQTANYVAVLTDADSKVVVMNVASSNTFTVPQFSSVAWPEGTILYVQNQGAGTTTLTAGTGVTFNQLLGSSATLLTGGIATLKHSATQNTWDVLNYTGGGSALTKTDDTNVTATLGGSPTTALSAAASITLGWTGTLSLARGGKGNSTDPTTGSVWFEGSSGADEDNSNLFFDNSGNMLGVALSGSAPTAYVDIGASTTANSSMRIRSGTAPTTKLDGQVWYDGTNMHLAVSTTDYVISKTLSNSASLNFPNTVAGTPQDLTITVTGAAVGDVVLVGAVPPNGNTFYYAWVSASNTVTVRLINVGADVDPSATTITAVVRK